MAKYPETPTRASGYTEQWISSYLKDKATASEINRYIKAIKGMDKKQARAKFIQMFIEGKTKPDFTDELKAIAKEKKEAEKAEKLAKEQAQEQAQG